jgi:hypothetical protein
MMRYFAGLAAGLLFAAGAGGNQDIRVGGQAGYFHPWGMEFRTIYGGGAQLGVEASVCFSSGLLVLAGGSHFSGSGRLSYTGEAISVRLVPLHLALGYLFSSERRMRPFIAGGISLNAFRESAPLETVKRIGLGLWAEAGIFITLTDWLVVEAKCVQNSLKMEFPESKVDLSGISALIGLKFSLARKER